MARVVEHRLAEKGRRDGEAVEAADQRVAVPDFDGMAETAGKELAIDLADGRIVSRWNRGRCRRCAAIDDTMKSVSTRIENVLRFCFLAETS